MQCSNPQGISPPAFPCLHSERCGTSGLTVEHGPGIVGPLTLLCVKHRTHTLQYQTAHNGAGTQRKGQGADDDDDHIEE